MSLQSQLKKPVTWLAIGGLVLVWLQWRPGFLGRALARQQSDFYRNLRTPREYSVALKNGKTVKMNNVQLANALDANAVKNFKQIS